jgi:hypothetical protein
MKMFRETIILLILILLLATIRISPLPEVNLMPAHAAVTEAEDSGDAVETLATPVPVIQPAQFNWQPSDCDHIESADTPAEAIPTPLRVINQVLRPTLQRLTDLDVRCSEGDPNTCVVIVRSATKT